MCTDLPKRREKELPSMPNQNGPARATLEERRFIQLN